MTNTPPYDEHEPVKIPVVDKRRVSSAPDTPQGQGIADDLPRSLTGEAEDSGVPTADGTPESGYLEDLQRLKAEFDNYRKRVIKEQSTLIESASRALVSRLLGVLDNFDLAVGAAEETRDFDRMLKGIEMVFGELKEVLAAEGLKTITAKDQRFDPNLHEAAVEVPGDRSGELVVAEVLRPGYMFNERVLRPAMVKVTQQAADAGHGG
ncbi:MAG: nucleotide exchange factor GrpE [Actinomycetota bacterium]